MEGFIVELEICSVNEQNEQVEQAAVGKVRKKTDVLWSIHTID